MNKKEFLEICTDRKFWQWIRNHSPKPYKDVGDKVVFLTNLYKKIAKRTYYPSPPEEYLTLNKGYGVLRTIPALSLEDLCIYYFCTRKLEKYIAINRVSGTFGGFGFSGKLRRVEEDEMQILTDKSGLVEIDSDHFIFADSSPYPSISSLNPKAWFAEWGDFTKKLYFSSSALRSGFVAELDISNFYDSIQLDNLEYKLRRAVPHQHNDILYLLMHFLRFWNRHINFYRQQGAGIPQDSFNECSRILANFYMQNYDSKISNFCTSKGGKFFRYADDQIVFAKSRGDLEEIIAKASSLLMREGLNFNQKKVNIMTMRYFRRYYCFDNFFKLANGLKNPKLHILLKEQITFYLRYRNSLKNGGVSLLKRILGLLGKTKRKPSNYDRLRKYLFKHFLPNNDRLSCQDLDRIYESLNARWRRALFPLLKRDAKQSFYTDSLYELRRFFLKHRVSIRPISARITYLRHFYSFTK